jgi:GNAT superfamily N-acetyltransferase
MAQATSRAAFQVQVIPATEIDPGEAVALANAAFSVHPLVTGPRATLDSFPDECPPGARIITVVADGQTVGMAMVAAAKVEMFGFSPDVAPRIQEKGIPGQKDLYFGIASVHPANQGQGIGRTLLQHAEVLARAEGFERVVLTTVRELGNVEYYERAGYTVVDAENFPPGHYSIPITHESCLLVKQL